MGVVKVARIFDQFAGTSAFSQGQLIQITTPVDSTGNPKKDFKTMSVDNKGWIIVGSKKDIIEFMAMNVHTVTSDTQKLYITLSKIEKKSPVYLKKMIKVATLGMHGVAEYVAKGISYGISSTEVGSKFIGGSQLILKSKGAEYSAFQAHNLFCSSRGIRGVMLASALAEYSGKIYKTKLKAKQFFDNSAYAVQIGKDGKLLPYGATEGYYDGVIEPMIDGQSLSNFAAKVM